MLLRFEYSVTSCSDCFSAFGIQGDSWTKRRKSGSSRQMLPLSLVSDCCGKMPTDTLDSDMLKVSPGQKRKAQRQ